MKLTAFCNYIPLLSNPTPMCIHVRNGCFCPSLPLPRTVPLIPYPPTHHPPIPLLLLSPSFTPSSATPPFPSHPPSLPPPSPHPSLTLLHFTTSALTLFWGGHCKCYHVVWLSRPVGRNGYCRDELWQV